MRIDRTTYRSPNHNARTEPISAVIIHSCEGRPRGAERRSSLPWLCNPQNKKGEDPANRVSCTYYVCRDGMIYELVPEELRAWHAGRGAIGSSTDPNGISIGIELEHSAGSGGYPHDQLAALRELLQDILRRHPCVTPERIVSHRACALPKGRKADPSDWSEPDFRAWVTSLRSEAP